MIGSMHVAKGIKLHYRPIEIQFQMIVIMGSLKFTETDEMAPWCL